MASNYRNPEQKGGGSGIYAAQNVLKFVLPQKSEGSKMISAQVPKINKTSRVLSQFSNKVFYFKLFPHSQRNRLDRPFTLLHENNVKIKPHIAKYMVESSALHWCKK